MDFTNHFITGPTDDPNVFKKIKRRGNKQYYKFFSNYFIITWFSQTIILLIKHGDISDHVPFRLF